MDMQGKTEAALEWAKTWPELDGFLKLNAILNEEMGATMVPVQNSTADKVPFIDGTARYRRIFMFRIMLPWSDGFDQINTDAERLATQWRDWVDGQFPHNIPDWPGAEIEGIESLSDIPAIQIYQDESLAEYNFQAKITFVE